MTEELAPQPLAAGSSHPSQQGPEKWVVLLVHGVGDTEPGRMIDLVTPAVAEVNPTLQLHDRYEVVRLPDDLPENKGRPTLFDVFLRRATAGSTKAVFAEVFWADLSRSREGTFELVVGIFRLIFGIRHLSDQAAVQQGRAAALLRMLVYATIFFLRGPLLALYLFGAIYSSLTALARNSLFPRWLINWADGSGSRGFFVAVGLTATAVGLGLLWWTRGRHFRFGAFGVCLTLCGLLGATLLGLAAPAWLFTYINWLHGYGISRPEAPEFYMATILCITDWGRALAFAPLTVTLGWLIVACCLAQPRDRPGLAAAYLAATLQMILWLNVLAPLDLVIDLGLTSGSLNKYRFTDVLPDFWEYYGFLLLFTYALLLAAIATWIARWRWARRNSVSSWPCTSPPRLIVGMAIQTALFLSSMVLSLLALLDILYQLRHYLPQMVEQARLQVSDIIDCVYPPPDILSLVWLVTIVLGVVLLVRSQILRDVLHVLMDVINHFHRPQEGFPTRRRIERRFRRVLEYMLTKERPTHLTIIAHSQGTVIALSVLGAQDWSIKLDSALEVNLVTVGSPFTHLYQHYFPLHYQPLSDERWRRLRERVPCWFNVFRVDDYVGTHIDGGNGEPLDSQQWPVNKAAGPGGHTHYWEQDVFNIIAHLLPGRRI
jgi:hypothetical protein